MPPTGRENQVLYSFLRDICCRAIGRRHSKLQAPGDAAPTGTAARISMVIVRLFRSQFFCGGIHCKLGTTLKGKYEETFRFSFGTQAVSS
jgi:hypothetical protein